MSISFNLNTLREYLNVNNIQESDKKTILDMFNNADVADDYGQNVKDNQLTRDEVPNFFNMITNNPRLLKIIEPFRLGLSPLNPVNFQNLSPEELAADRLKLESKIKDTFEKAKNELVTRISQSNLTFSHPTTGKSIPAKDLLESLKNVDYAPDTYGGAQALKDSMRIRVNTTPSDGKNPPPLSSQWNCSVEEAMKILLHEALHNEYARQGADPGFNTQKQELYVEKNAILLLSQITDNKDIIIHGQKLSDLVDNDELLETTLQNEFINRGYPNRPKDSTGAVNIMGYELSPEDKVYVNGELKGSIGAPPEACLFDQLSEKDIRVAGSIGGKIVLSQVEGSESIEVRDPDGNVKFKAYIIQSRNFGI